MPKTAATASDDRALLLRIVEEAYDRSTWNATNLRAALRGVGPEEAAWAPEGSKHAIRDIVVHCAYWKHVIGRRLLGERRRMFPLQGRDWFDFEGPLAMTTWPELLDILDVEHRKLCTAIAETDKELRFASRSGRERSRDAFGVAMHDAYHTGQVHLIRAMHARA